MIELGVPGAKLPADGSLEWRVPEDQQTGDDFRVQVVLYEGPEGSGAPVASGFSGTFSIRR